MYYSVTYAVHMFIATLAALPPELPPADLFMLSLRLFLKGFTTGPNAL